MYLGWFDGGIWNYAFVGSYIAPATTYYVDVPATTSKFRLEFVSNGNGGAGGHANKFVDIDWIELAPGNTLPIELIAWDAFARDNNIVLKWVTGSEINNEKFDVLWSPDGETWEIIHTQKGVGNSSVATSYYAVHNTDSSNNYYKLRQTDFDGTVEEFDIVYMYIREKDLEEKTYLYFNPLGQLGGIQLKKETK
jgi:hypothetical protein